MDAGIECNKLPRELKPSEIKKMIMSYKNSKILDYCKFMYCISLKKLNKQLFLLL